jgi:hypothetical protein
VPNVATSWAEPAWLADVHAWIAKQVAACGLAVTGPTEQPHLRCGSTVLRGAHLADGPWGNRGDGSF